MLAPLQIVVVPEIEADGKAFTGTACAEDTQPYWLVIWKVAFVVPSGKVNVPTVFPEGKVAVGVKPAVAN